MRRQRNMAQMKEQIKTPDKELSKIEISNLSDAEFKTLVIRMLKEPWLMWFSGLRVVCEAKGPQFDSQSGPMPGLWARSPVGGK